MKTTRVRIAAAALAVLALPSLAGCWSGNGATTNMEATMNSGNGVHAQVGDIDVENATLVLGPEGAKNATLLASFVAPTGKGDKLIGVTVNGKPAQIFVNGALATSLDVLPGTTVKVGWEATNFVNAYEFEAAESAYVPVELSFERSGIGKLQLLTVPALGQYEGIVPTPATPIVK